MGRWIEPVTRYLAYFGAFLTVVIMLLVVADVVGTYVFNQPLVGSYELVSILIPVTAFICLPNTEVGEEKANIKMELFASRLSPQGKHILVFFSYLIGAALLGLLTQQTGIDMVYAIAIKQVEWGLVELPLYLFKPFITLGFALSTLVFLLCAANELRDITARPMPDVETEVKL